MSTYFVPIVLVSAGLYVWKRFSSLPTFPGPKPLPILGNALQMPKDRPWLTFAKWAKEYGNCVYLSALGQPILVVASLQVANELLDKRSSIYSDRPILPMASDLCGFRQTLALMPYIPTFHQTRQLFKKELTTSSLKNHWPAHENESRKLVKRFLDNPAELAGLTRYYTGSLILRVVYGYPTASINDPCLVLAQKILRAFSEAARPGYWAVDIFPWLKYVPTWIPGAGFKKKAAEWSQLNFEITSLPYRWARSNQESPNMFKPNFVSNLLSNVDTLSSEEDSLLMWGAGSLFGGGVDTSVSVIQSFYLAMALHPEIQEKAQKEIDRVLKGERLPRIEDTESLPFIKNIVKEVLRWNPVAPMGLPHRLTQDDVYKGFKIPKGTIVIPNAWSMLHDPEVYPEPDRFNPDRFVGNPVATKALDTIFGFGRRACPGMAFAETSVFIVVATALAVCTFSDARDKEGQKLTASALVYTSETLSHPPQFTCKIESRSSAALELLRAEL